MPLRTSIMHRGTVAVPAMKWRRADRGEWDSHSLVAEVAGSKACVLQSAHIRAKANVFRISAMGLR